MRTRFVAVMEVVAVFVLTLALVALVGISPVGLWERGVSDHFFLEYIAMIAVPLLILLLSRRNLADYGITARNLRYHLDVAATALIPVALSFVPLMRFSERKWDGALVMAVTKVALLVVVAWLLRKKPTAGEGAVLAGLAVLWLAAPLAQAPGAGKAISALLFYLLFLGPGEELLFRGYIQSRLNIAFGRPFRFFGVPWGWGLVVTAFLFGLMHVLNLGSLVMGSWRLAPWWGFWTFFAAFVSGFIREKTGSIVAPAILHGLPQGLASAFGEL